VAKKIILSTLHVKPGEVLPPAITEMMNPSHVSDAISSIFEERKDCVSINSSEAKKFHMQKQMILRNRKEA
jgi:hypothetical protein